MKRYFYYAAMTLITTLSMLVIFSGFSYKADLKLGYINSDRVFAEYSKFKEGGQTLEQERIQLQQDLQVKQKEFEDRRKEFDSQQLLMSEKRKEEAGKELEQLYISINNFTQENFSQGGKLEQRWAEITRPIIAEIQIEIDKIGKEQGYDMIFDTKEGNVLYGKEEYDITQTLLDVLEEKK